MCVCTRILAAPVKGNSDSSVCNEVSYGNKVVSNSCFLVKYPSEPLTLRFYIKGWDIHLPLWVKKVLSLYRLDSTMYKNLNICEAC